MPLDKQKSATLLDSNVNMCKLRDIISKPASWHINSADFIGKTHTHTFSRAQSTTLHTPEMRTKRESPNLFWDIRKCTTKQRFACLRRGTVLIVYIYSIYKKFATVSKLEYP